MANTDAFEAQILNHLFRGAAIASYTPFLALLLQNPGDAPTTLSEPGGAYARLSLAPFMGNAATVGTIVNNGIITFAQNNTGSAYRILAIGIVDHATANLPVASLKAYAICDVTVAANGTPTIAAGALQGFEE